MLKLYAMKKALAFLNVLRFGRVRIYVGNLFQSRVPVVLSKFECDLGTKMSREVDILVPY